MLWLKKTKAFATACNSCLVFWHEGQLPKFSNTFYDNNNDNRTIITKLWHFFLLLPRNRMKSLWNTMTLLRSSWVKVTNLSMVMASENSCPKEYVAYIQIKVVANVIQIGHKQYVSKHSVRGHPATLSTPKKIYTSEILKKPGQACFTSSKKLVATKNSTRNSRMTTALVQEVTNAQRPNWTDINRLMLSMNDFTSCLLDIKVNVWNDV